MPKAIWEGMVIAESNHCEVVEGNQYFPPETIKKEYFKPSNHTTRCHWKGTAHYYDIVVNGKTNPEAAWFYPEPFKEAGNIKNHVAFWKGVKVLV